MQRHLAADEPVNGAYDNASRLFDFFSLISLLPLNVHTLTHFQTHGKRAGTPVQQNNSFQ